MIRQRSLMKRVLVAAAVFVRHAGVVGQGLVAERRELGRDLLDVGPANAIDEARLVRVAADHLANLPHQVAAAANAIDQVRPIERTDQHLRLAEAELADDVVADVRRGGGRVGVERDVGEAILEHPQPAILGAEVVPPFADAVGLVDRQERERHLLQEVERPVGEQSLGREVEQLQPLGFDLVGDLAFLGGRERAVDAGRADAAVDQRVDLVLHQRDQRRDDDREPRHGERRRLEAEALAAAGGEHDERIAPLDDGPHRLGLQRAEVVIPPILAENGPKLIHPIPCDRIAMLEWYFELGKFPTRAPMSHSRI